MGNPPAPQMPAKYLDYLKSQAFYVFDEWGQNEGWDGIPPVPFLGAIVANESGGQNLPPNDFGAQGPMQMTPTGMEASYWQQATGETLTAQSLSNPDKNTQAGIFGLGQRMKKGGYKDWGYAGVGYFGGHVDSNGVITGGDVNETAQDYYNNIYSTIQTDKDASGNAVDYGFPMTTILDAVKNGKWFRRGSTDGAPFDTPIGYNAVAGDIKTGVNDAKTAYDWTKAVGEFLSNPTHAAEVIGLTGAGLMLILIGLHGVIA